jgi:hypothetical protein
MSTSVPNLHVSTQSRVKGSATVLIQSRADIVSHSGTFTIKVDLQFNPASDDYPTGTIKITVDLSDSIKATFASTSIELVNSFGKHNPTAIFTGRCKVVLGENAVEPKGCKYWVIIADNKSENMIGTPTIVGFVITDRAGVRSAYGMGPVKSGDLRVDPV